MLKKILNGVVALIVVIIGYFTTTQLPKGKKHEKYYQTKMCNKLVR